MSSVAALLRSGDLRAAREQWDVTLASADEVETAALLECGRILTCYPRTATAHLRAAWQRATDPRIRAVIEACVPRPDYQAAHSPGSESEQGSPRWDRHAIERARATRRTAEPVSTDNDAKRRRDRRQQQQAAQSLTAHLAYATANPATDHEPHRTGARPDGYAVDYEQLAVNPVMRDRERRDPRRTAVSGNGRPCVALGCHVEPSRADRQQRDGLCQECREAGRPGIEAPEDANPAQMIEALCAYIWQNYPAALDHLRREWTRCSSDADRATVAAWVKANVPELPAEPVSVPEFAACATCAAARGPRDLRQQPADDGQCASCRTLDDTAPEKMITPAAVESAPEPELIAA
ncbi:hypothetical protein [Saccharopolyspora mangrovi]|uniref:Uncharacterized protein n=1 Tax=Saccharopolyspora mangrovi TaxID=3082379 RepID=A0ABU6AIF1_9PSEU|nr:hypothetical protein [Saccharopolyspora sp. S2-29]MEB3371300.1 hypothetical protein [Saccharopolyspora sp. S2-29]